MNAVNFQYDLILVQTKVKLHEECEITFVKVHLVFGFNVISTCE